MVVPVSKESEGENADIVFVIEDTANLFTHFPIFDQNYLNKLLR